MDGADFLAEQEVDYLVETSTNLADWIPRFEVSGGGNSFFIPLVESSFSTGSTSSSQGGSAQNESQNDTVMIYLQKLGGGGTAFAWSSLDGNGAIRWGLPNTALVEAWANTPFYSKGYGDFYFLIVALEVGGSEVTPASVQPSLGPKDQRLLDELLFRFPAIQIEIAGNVPQPAGSVLLPSLAEGMKQFIRVQNTGLTDTDNDGISDKLEKKPISQGGTGTDPYDSDSDDDKVEDGAEVVADSNPNNNEDRPSNIPFAKFEGQEQAEGHSGEATTEGGQNVTSSSPIFDAVVIEVEFHKSLKISSDSLKVNYGKLKWKAGSHNYPIAYIRNESPTLKAKFYIKDLPVDFKPKVKASLPNGMKLEPEIQELVKGPNDNEWIMKETGCSGKLLDSIKFYSAQIEDKEFSIKWEVFIPSDGALPAFVDAGTTCHTLYQVDAKPKKKDTQETLFYLGCKNAELLKADANKIAEFIYRDFLKDKPNSNPNHQLMNTLVADVHRVVPTMGKEREEPLTYYADLNSDGFPESSGKNCSDNFSILLASTHGNGSCAAWSTLLNRVFAKQGIESQIVELHSIHGAVPFSADVTAQTTVSSLVGREVDFGASRDFGKGPLFQWKTGDNAFLNPVVATGQGATKPPLVFKSHIIVERGSILYDPSYGIPEVSGPEQLKKYEDIAFSGYTNETHALNSSQYLSKNQTSETSSAEVKKSRRKDLE